MSDFTDDEILAYLGGTAPPERRSEIERQAKADPDLRQKMEAVAAVCDLLWVLPWHGRPSPAGGIGGPRPFWLIASAVLLAAVLGLGLGLLLHPVPETTRHFSPPPPPPAPHTPWKPGRLTVRIEPEHVRLLNRGSLVTTEEFPAPLEVRFDWRWSDIPGNTDYPEILTVVLHTAGEHLPVPNFRTMDGLEIVFQAANGEVHFCHATNNAFTKHTPEHAVALPDREWHSVRIVDDGRKVDVFVYPKGKAEPSRPILTAPYQSAFQKHHVAVYNREFAGQRPHESHIANFTVRHLPAAK